MPHLSNQTRLSLRAAALLATACAAGCMGPPSDTAFRISWESDAGFWDAPWPSETRRREDGSIRIDDFPVPEEHDLVSRYRRALDTDPEAGFGTSAGIYLPLEGDFAGEPGSWETRPDLPAPEGTLDPSQGFFLVDVDPESAERGRLVPVELALKRNDDIYTPGSVLVLLPLSGIPLAQNTLHAAVVLEGALEGADGLQIQAAEDFSLALAGRSDNPEVDLLYAPLRETLRNTLRVPPRRVAAATVFRTGNPTAGMTLALESLEDLAETNPPGFEQLDVVLEDATCQVQLAVDMPQFQEGQSPYLASDENPRTGGFVWEDDRLVVQRWERTLATLTVPRRQRMPEDGFPILIHSHGTGGDNNSLLYASSEEGLAYSPAAYLGMQGIATLTPEAPLHGERSPVIGEVAFLNIYNPHALRDNIRQAALEMAWLLSAVEDFSLPRDSCPPHFSIVDDRQAAEIRTEDTGLWGHSQGGTVGPLWLATDPRAGWGVFTGAGGNWGLTVTTKTAPIDVPLLISDVMGIDREELDRFDPALSLVQAFGEPADPIAYAPTFREERGGNVDLLFLVGLGDTYVHPQTQHSLAAAAGADLVGPSLDEDGSWRIGLAGGEAVSYPSAANDADGTTRAMTQYAQPEERNGHFVAWAGGSTARRQIACFAHDAAAGREPSIIDESGAPFEACP